MKLTVTAYGSVGTGYWINTDWCSARLEPSLEFPTGSRLEYLFWAGFWIGAVKGEDTLVSTAGGWVSGAWPGEWGSKYTDDVIRVRTNLPVLHAPSGSYCDDVYFSEDAVSEQDYVVRLWDTANSLITDPDRIDPIDGRLHEPLGLEVTQKSYAWSSSVAQGLIAIDYEIKNVGRERLRDAYAGFWVIPRSHYLASPYAEIEWSGEIVGSIRTLPSPLGEPYRDTVNTVWYASSDGHPGGGGFDSLSPTSAIGIRVLKAPGEGAGFSFNWWLRGYEGIIQDWGPNRQGTHVEFPSGNLGTPYGDKAKYEMMSNGEIDYDQVEAAINHTGEGWLPPPTGFNGGRDLADGAWPEFLISCGPFDLPPDSAVPFTLALVGARDFHVRPDNFKRFFDPNDPSRYYANLNFENLELIAQSAGWMYDTPGKDTDGDGYRGKYRIVQGDTVYYEGDGVPDWNISSAPPSPRLQSTTAEGKIVVQWNGELTEMARDAFTTLRDFEGYRVYLSRTGHPDDFRLLTQRDNVNWSRHRWYRPTGKWKVTEPPFTLDSLKTMFDSICVADYGYPFHPDSFTVPVVEKAFLEEVLDERDPAVLDSNIYYFTPYEANAKVDDRLYAQMVANGREAIGVIRKVYPDAPPDSLAYREDGSAYRPYYEYEYAIEGLQVAEPIFMAVTAFDCGNPAIGLKPEESSPTANAVEVWPINSVAIVKSEHPKPGVYPNPYRISDAYNAAGWENPRGMEPDKERARKVTFYNVPDTCIVSIWSLDGDLIRRLDHKSDPNNSEASVVVWNLITRNTQAIKTGIYLYSIESRFGTDVGKLVIIK